MTEIDKILEKDVMTEDEFLLCISKSCIDKNSIGKEVIIPNALSNAQVSPNAYNDTYIIADVFHDYVEGAVDLIAKNVVNKGEPLGLKEQNVIVTTTTAYYVNSYIDDWLNNEFLNGFSENIKNALVDMQIESNGSIIHRKIKIPSSSELGFPLIDILTEGHAYPIFTDNDSRIKCEVHQDENGNTISKPVIYWTRSRAINYNGYSMTISENGNGVTCYFYNNVFGVVPVMRFKNVNPYSDGYLTIRVLTEEQFLYYAENVGFTKDFIGKEVVISNNGRQELFEIADIDHDRSIGSLDLISKGVVMDGEKIPFGSSDSYKDSNLRSYLNNDYYNGFSDAIKSHMRSMVCANPYDLNHPFADMVKALSATELGLDDGNDYSDGNKYSLFDVNDPDSMMRGQYGSSYLLRTASGTGMVYAYGYQVLSSEPYMFQTPYSVSHNVVAAIRIINNSGCDDILSRNWLYTDEFIHCLKKSAITKDHIGKTVDIWSASSRAEYRTYVIADVNHDGKENTVDLVSLDPIVKFIQFDSSDRNVNYSQSSIRQYLNGEYYNGLIDAVKERLVPFKIYRNASSGNGEWEFVEEKDYVRPLTCTEVGFKEYSHLDDNKDPSRGCKYEKGSLYPIFTDDASRVKYIDYNGKRMQREYWLMTEYDLSKDVMGVSEFGGYGAYRSTSNLGVVTVMRFYQGDAPSSDSTESNTENEIG